MKKILLAISFIFQVGLQHAIAANNQSFSENVFLELDVNHDGIIDKYDIEKYSDNEFELMDTNKDGTVSKDEFFKFVCEKSCKHGNCECKDSTKMDDLEYLNNYFEKVDSNKDGKIDRLEKLNDNLNGFSSLDLDFDGKITREEIETQLD